MKTAAQLSKVGKKVKESLSPGLMILSDDSECEGGEGVDLCVVDVCCNEEVFSQFVEEWKAKKKFSMAVAVDRHKERVVDSGVRPTGNA